jgi:hypothetical protein
MKKYIRTNAPKSSFLSEKFAKCKALFILQMSQIRWSIIYCTNTCNPPQDICYTCNGKTVYAIVLDRPGENKQIAMALFGKGNKAECIKIKDVSLLGKKEKIKWERNSNGFIANTSTVKTNDMAIVFKIRTSG